MDEFKINRSRTKLIKLLSFLGQISINPGLVISENLF